MNILIVSKTENHLARDPMFHRFVDRHRAAGNDVKVVHPSGTAVSYRADLLILLDLPTSDHHFDQFRMRLAPGGLMLSSVGLPTFAGGNGL